MYSCCHIKFLEMLGWHGSELEEFLPEWLRAAKLLGLNDSDVEFAVEKWIPEYWDLSLEGVKKFIAACIRDAADLAKGEEYLARGDKLIYVNMPGVPLPLMANVTASKGRVHVHYPAYLIVTVLGAFFNKYCGKYNPSCDNGSMRSPCANCAMNRIRYNASTESELAQPTVHWNWGLRCNEAPKTDEMISCDMGSTGSDVYVTLPHDVDSGIDEADYRPKIDYLSKKLRDAQERVSRLTGFAVSEADISEAAGAYIKYMDKLQTLTDLVMNADPMPLSGAELTMFGIFVEMCLGIGNESILDALDTVIGEVRVRISKGEGLLPKDSPRLACHFNPLCVPWLDKAFRDNGVCLVQGKLLPFADKFRKFLSEEDDIYKAIARIILSIPSTMNMLDEARINAELVTRYPVDGALYGFYSSDVWVGALQKTMVKVIEAETGVPHFYIEGELWNSGDGSYDSHMAIVRSICNYLKISNIGT